MVETLLVVLACAPAPPEGKYVSISAEQAVIVWDEAAKREHFIRRAAFETDAPDFGFLVPTPARPELAEVPPELFDELREATKPKLVPKHQLEPTLSLFFLARRRARGRCAASPCSRSRTSPATRPRCCRPMIPLRSRRGSPSTATALSDWLKPYVEKKWTVTAFKVVERATAAVRMSFETERPFFPYREPLDQLAKGHARQLRVYFVGPWKASAVVGSAGFPGVTYWAQPFSGKLPVAAPAGAWLTVFDDFSSPRPGVDELFFSKAGDQAAVMPEVDDVRDVPVPLDCLCVVAVIAGFGVRVFRRRNEPRSPSPP